MAGNLEHDTPGVEIEDASKGLEEIEQKQESRPRPSMEEPPYLELKILLKHLECAFFTEGSKLPVIITSNLSTEKK